MVASENTTPQPKVSYGRLRSTTVMSWPGSSFFISRANVRPAGPPPMQTMRMQSSAILRARCRRGAEQMLEV